MIPVTRSVFILEKPVVVVVCICYHDDLHYKKCFHIEEASGDSSFYLLS